MAEIIEVNQAMIWAVQVFLKCNLVTRMIPGRQVAIWLHFSYRN